MQTTAGGRVMRTGDERRDHRRSASTGRSPSATGAGSCASIEQDAEGAHNLDAEIVASPWDDEARMHDEALVEGAVGGRGAARDARRPSSIDVDLDADARAQALDLALADARFAPDVLEVAARRAAEGWAEAVDGEDDALLAVADPQAVDALLYGGDASRRTRLVVRGPRVTACGSSALDATPSRRRCASRSSVQRPPLRRGPRHRRRARGLEGPRDLVHRALDDRARPATSSTVAARRRRLRSAVARSAAAAPARSPWRSRSHPWSRSSSAYEILHVGAVVAQVGRHRDLELAVEEFEVLTELQRSDLVGVAHAYSTPHTPEWITRYTRF